MSYKLTPREIDVLETLQCARHKVLSAASIASELRLNTNNVRSYCSKLKKLGLIEKIDSTRINLNSNVYKLTVNARLFLIRHKAAIAQSDKAV